MKLLLVISFFFIPTSLFAQVLKSGSITTAGADCTVTTNCLEVNTLKDIPSVAINVDVGTTGTFVFEATVDNIVWRSIPDDIAGATSTTADGVFFFSNPGYNKIRVRASAINGAAPVVIERGYANLRSTATLTGGGGDGALIDGVSAAIKATVLDLTNTNPLTVAITDANGTQITSFGGGTQYTEDVASAADPIGTMSIARRRDTLTAAEVSTDSDNIALNATSKGELYVKNTDPIPATQSGTWNIGTVTTVTGVTTVAAVTAITNALPAGNNNIGDVDVVTLPALPAGANNIGSVNVAAVPADPYGANADAASSSGSISAKLRFIASTGIPITGTVTVGSHNVTNAGTFAVQADTELAAAAALTDAFANPTIPGVGSFNMCWNGATWDRCLKSSLTEATQDGALTVGTTVGNISMFRASAAAPTPVDADNDAVVGWALRNGSPVVNLASGGTLITSTGTSINMNCTGGCTSTSITDDAAFTIATSTVVPIGGVFATDSVDAGDTGAIRMSANRNLFINIRDAAGNERGLNVTAGNAILVDGSATTQPVSLATNTPVGSVAHDGVGTSVNPILIGAYASAAAPSDVTADGDATRLWVLRNGSQVTNLAAGGTLITSTGSSINVVCTSGCGGSGGTSMTDDAAFTIATTSITPIGGTYKSVRDAVDDNDGGALAMNQKRGLYVTLETPNADSAMDDTLDTLKVSQATAANFNATVVGTGTFSVQDTQVIADDAAFTAATSKVTMAGFVADEASTDSVNEDDAGAARMTLDRIAYAAPAAVTASTQATTGCYLVSAASTNSTSCKGSAGNLYGIRFVNTTATLYYLRLYNSSAAPTCSSATGFIESIPIPASATGAGVVWTPTYPINYGTGIGFCFTGGSSSTDNTNAAVGVFGAIQYK